MLRVCLALIVSLLCAAAASAASVRLAAADEPSFPLVQGNMAAPIVLPPGAPEVVRIAARDFAADVETVAGVRPAILEEAPDDVSLPRVQLVLAPADLAGRWEAFRLSASPGALVVAGSDRRGLAYGVYELSRRIGVSPWTWWADVPAPRHPELRFSFGEEPVDQPAVKYRGIFINDEGWGLVPWASKTHDPDAGNLGPKTYSRVFELLLRLRANTLWPAMHPGTTPFHQMPGNAAAADRHAIVLGSSHAEPMLRNNVGEWTDDKDRYNYVVNREGVLAYWEQRVKERASGESLFTLGMRGIHDSPIVGPKDQAGRISVLGDIFSAQRDMLARHLGDGDATRVGQIFCPYKEVLEDYLAGLSVPDDVTLVWPDDNFGYIRRFASPAERRRSGGLGVYYHASYLGAPLPWLWVDTLPHALVWSEMTRAYEQGARNLWIVNVGDIKNTELATEFFLDLAWHADRTSPAAPADHLRAVAARDFGAERAAAIADIWIRHQALAFARRPEHLAWHLPRAPYRPTTLVDEEIQARLADYAALLSATETVEATLPAAARDAFFQLVAYPVGSAAAANRRYFQAELARRLKVRGDEAAARSAFAESEAAAGRIAELTRRYNEDIAGGKWRHIVMVNGLSPRQWPSFQLPPILPLDDADALAAVRQQESARAHATTPAPPPLVVPAGARPGDFVEHNGVVSILAGNFTNRADLPSGAGWRVIPRLGRSGAAVTVLPSTADLGVGQAPRLSYRFHLATAFDAAPIVRVRLLPTHPIAAGQGLRLALAIDDGDPLALAVTSGFDPKSAAWKERVLANATEAELRLPAPLAPGWHILHLVAVDAGVVVDKIVLDLGGLRLSYDGPPETHLP